MKDLLKSIVVAFGYADISDFSDTIFTFKGVLVTTLLVSVSFSTMTVYIEHFIGLKPIAYLSLIVLFVLEFLTGVSASVFVKGQDFNSLKMGRIVLKIFVYSVILGLLNIFTQNTGKHEVFGIDFNFYEWIYFVILNVLVIQLFVSVLENLETLGFKEVSPLLRVFKRKIQKLENDYDIEILDDDDGKEEKQNV